MSPLGWKSKLARCNLVWRLAIKRRNDRPPSRDRDYGASRTSENLSKVIAKSAARQRAVVLAAAFAALEIEDRPDFFSVQKVGRPAISLFNQSFLDIIPVLAFARSGELHGPSKYLLVFLSHRVVLLPHRASGVGLAIIPQG
jgi:hypothetical protein